MNDFGGVEIVLLGLDELVADTEESVHGLGESIDTTGERLVQLDARLRLLTGNSTPDDPERAQHPRRTQLVQRPPEASAATLDELVGERESHVIERRFRRETTLRARLDRYDVICAITAGLVATLVDRLLVRVPQESSVTVWLRDHATTDDNWMSDLAKVPYDRVTGTGVRGMGPNTHRVQTPGHDPLIGLILGTSDIMHGRMTATDPSGRLRRIASPMDEVDSLVEALGIQILHLLSDVCTSSGLPMPGWAVLSANQVEIGGRPIAEIAREMFIRGYDSWHLMTMSTTPASVEFGCRLYWGARCALDQSFEQQTESVEDDPRYRSISLLAHGVAAACDAAEFAATGNPLALNWPQWLMFSNELANWLKTSAPLPSQTLSEQFAANRALLDSGWEDLWVGSVPSAPTGETP